MYTNISIISNKFIAYSNYHKNSPKQFQRKLPYIKINVTSAVFYPCKPLACLSISSTTISYISPKDAQYSNTFHGSLV